MNELIQPILALGGFGYLNYLFYDRISSRNFKTEMDKKFFIGVMSSMNYILYLLSDWVISHWVKGNFLLILCIFFTLIVSFFFTRILPNILTITFKYTNKIRSREGMSEQITKKVYYDAFGNDKQTILFIFSIPDNSLISSGYAELFSGEGEDLSLKNIGLYWDEPCKGISTEAALLYFLENKNIKAEIYLNFDKKIKIIYFEVPDVPEV